MILHKPKKRQWGGRLYSILSRASDIKAPLKSMVKEVDLAKQLPLDLKYRNLAEANEDIVTSNILEIQDEYVNALDKLRRNRFTAEDYKKLEDFTGGLLRENKDLLDKATINKEDILPNHKDVNTFDDVAEILALADYKLRNPTAKLPEIDALSDDKLYEISEDLHDNIPYLNIDAYNSIADRLNDINKRHVFKSYSDRYADNTSINAPILRKQFKGVFDKVNDQSSKISTNEVKAIQQALEEGKMVDAIPKEKYQKLLDYFDNIEELPEGLNHAAIREALERPKLVTDFNDNPYAVIKGYSMIPKRYMKEYDDDSILNTIIHEFAHEADIYQMDNDEVTKVLKKWFNYPAIKKSMPNYFTDETSVTRELLATLFPAKVKKGGDTSARDYIESLYRNGYNFSDYLNMTEAEPRLIKDKANNYLNKLLPSLLAVASLANTQQ